MKHRKICCKNFRDKLKNLGKTKLKNIKIPVTEQITIPPNMKWGQSETQWIGRNKKEICKIYHFWAKSINSKNKNRNYNWSGKDKENRKKEKKEETGKDSKEGKKGNSSTYREKNKI